MKCKNIIHNNISYIWKEKILYMIIYRIYEIKNIIHGNISHIQNEKIITHGDISYIWSDKNVGYYRKDGGE